MIFAVVGTRPEVIKMAPVVLALRRRGLEVALVATGQHHDWLMMGAFLERFALSIDYPEGHRLELGRRDLLGSFVEITAGLGALIERHRPELVLAAGDTTTVVAAAFAARKAGSAFGHVESGLRAFCRQLPEEEHRICADAMADLAFAPTRIALDNLERERVNGRVLLTGNPILDALRWHQPGTVPKERRAGILVTVHRQETVDDPVRLGKVLAALKVLGQQETVLWPVHPRTRAKAREHGLDFPATVRAVDPLGHGEFLEHLARARLVVTDSGGVQEEAAILGTPCVTVRRNTERPETIEAGVGLLAGIETAGILNAVRQILRDWDHFARPVPELYGDGRAGEHIAAACAEFLGADAASETMSRAARK
jgi:UDP-N-acetylglucosamine 2-epimerase (non-hydrolysing)